MEFISVASLAAFFQVVLVDLVLAGDNAIVVGMAVAWLPRARRVQAMLLGIAGATVLRIVFAIFTVELLEVIGLLLALTVWVAPNWAASWTFTTPLHR